MINKGSQLTGQKMDMVLLYLSCVQAKNTMQSPSEKCQSVLDAVAIKSAVEAWDVL